MNQSQLLSLFKESGAYLSGHFILTSGLHADTYLQCAKVLMHPGKSEIICKALKEKITAQFKKNAFDIVVSPAMGGLIVGYELARQLGLPAIFCERVDGKFVLRRGFTIEKNARVLIVEDVVTTGKSSLETIECVESYGGKVIAEAAIINRNLHNPLPVPLISLANLEIKTYTANNLPAHLKDLPAVKPGSRDLKLQNGK